MPELACPAAAFIRPVLSLNEHDVECQIAGHIRQAEGSPCVQAIGQVCYPRCAIWRAYKDIGQQVLDQKIPKPHDLGLTRS